jgi:hypothetical protein
MSDEESNGALRDDLPIVPRACKNLEATENTTCLGKKYQNESAQYMSPRFV